MNEKQKALERQKMKKRILALVVQMAFGGVAAAQTEKGQQPDKKFYNKAVEKVKALNNKSSEAMSDEKKAALEKSVKVVVSVDKKKTPLFQCHKDAETCRKFESQVETVIRYSATHALYSKDPQYDLVAYGVLYDKIIPTEKLQFIDAVKLILTKNTEDKKQLEKQIAAFCNTCKYKVSPSSPTK